MRSYAKSDLSEINEWYRAHDQSEVIESDLSSLGIIEPGVAVGFLYKTDSSLCLLEGLVTNPRASSEDRGHALYEIVVLLMCEAHTLGFKKVLGFTRDLSIQERAIMHGFRDLGIYHLFLREL